MKLTVGQGGRHEKRRGGERNGGKRVEVKEEEEKDTRLLRRDRETSIRRWRNRLEEEGERGK